MTDSTAAADNGVAAAGVDMSASKAENGSAAAAGTKAEAQSAEVRQVRLPAGWEGLSFKLDPVGRLIVSEVPKACFSSAAFGAKPQVAGVAEGDEVCTLNGEAPARAVERIMSQGDGWNACSSSSPPHAVGSKGKFDSPPCVACDFIRRRQGLGLDVALQMWLRAVKRDIQITLGVCAPGEAPAGGSGRSLLSLELPEGVVAAPARSTEARSSIVDLSASSSVTGSIAELKSLDELSGRSGGGGAKGKGKGKKGKGKGKGKDKGKAKRPTGPDLPRTRLSTEKASGEVVEWKGKYGWIKPSKAVDHPLAGKHKGRLYIHSQDLEWADELTVGAICHFHLFSDASGLGAEEIEEDGDWDPDAGEEGGDGQEWSEQDWEAWEKGDGKDDGAVQGAGTPGDGSFQ
mmetsp:Transcript_141483/g.451869  ORF Transcript_141483/g.451869 Transcript_141483/m.451869 type:complete len:402 (-) Transcript_141483:18-1223(-)